MLHDSLRLRPGVLGRGGRPALAIWAMIRMAVCGRALVSPWIPRIDPTVEKAGRTGRAGRDLYGSSPSGPHLPRREGPLVFVVSVSGGVLPDRVSEIMWRLSKTAIYLGGAAWWLAVAPATWIEEPA